MSADRLEALRASLTPAGPNAWIVGGGLRDTLLGRPVGDVDLAVAGDAGEVARVVATAYRARRFRLSEAFGAWRVHGGSLPFTVDITPLQGGSLADDLGRRDLTVNALALPVAGGALIDPHGGSADLAAGTLRMVAAGAFAADPVRIVRVARLACQLGFTIDPDTRLRARMDAGLVTASAPERVVEELGRIARLPDAWRGVEALDDLGALGVIFPALEEGRGLEQTPYHHKDVLGHTLEVVEHACAIRADPAGVFRGSADRLASALAEPLADGLTRGDALMFAALLHDMAKPETYAVTPEGRATFVGHDRRGAELAAEWCVRHRTSTRFRRTMEVCVRHHLGLGFLVHRQPLSLRQIDRYLRATEAADAELLVLSVADRLATNGARTTPAQIQRHVAVAREVAGWWVRLADRGPVRPVLTGAALARLLDRPAGPWTAQLLEAMREEQVVGRIATTAQAAAFARRWADDHPLGVGSPPWSA